MIELLLNKNGNYEYCYDVKQQEEITIKVTEGVEATCVLCFHGESFALKKTLELYPYSSLHIVYRNECSAYRSEEKVILHEDAHLCVGYYELGDHSANVDAVYSLVEREAKVDIITTSLAENQKQFYISCEHQCGHTYSNMEHYAINKAGGSVNITASGKIMKGAKESQSHQSTRVLTLADKEKVSITPLLLIDENDVAASHACAIGEMNEDHLYYLQTRGLSKEAALGLLTLSYVLPILRVVESWEIMYQQLSEDINSKVGLA